MVTDSPDDLGVLNAVRRTLETLALLGNNLFASAPCSPEYVGISAKWMPQQGAHRVDPMRGPQADCLGGVGPQFTKYA